MIEILQWTKREFSFDLPVGVFPGLLERLRGTSARAKELVAGTSEDDLAARLDGKWSAKDHLGHLVDLQLLDEQRLCEFIRRTPVLSAADISNRATEQGNHRQTPVKQILKHLKVGREQLVQKLEALTEEEAGIAAVHPRLQKSMRVLDWIYFVAEHDDHHLAKARRAILTASKRANTGREDGN